MVVNPSLDMTHGPRQLVLPCTLGAPGALDGAGSALAAQTWFRHQWLSSRLPL